MRAIALSVLLLGLAGTASAFDASKLDYSIMAGYAKPVGGAWAKNYRSSPFVGAGVEYNTGTEFRWGVELGYDTGHEHKVVTKYDPGMLFIAPYMKEYRFYDSWEYYAQIGVGLYHRVSPEYTDAGATYEGGLSGKLGANGGLGFSYYLAEGFKVGIDLRVHHAIEFLGIGPEMASATNFTPSLTLNKKF